MVDRLPLRNLHWQTPSRPLRQIRTLHVELIPDRNTQGNDKQNVTSSDPHGQQTSIEIIQHGRDPPQDGVKERRHQIPGLKTSPYLRIYVLRCDDKDQYKERDRTRIREWIRSNAIGEFSSNQSHDACDWLILHVVLPGTIAASEPRWRDSSKDADELKERPKSSAKWPGKSTKTVLDRLRADFNESSKSSPDRIAQIRLQKKDVSSSFTDHTPDASVTVDVIETQHERDNAWSDLISKMKLLILGPFDARVRQYEADIAKQESRRNLPGWNFCTFFIHKESLARALESIGLVEDALAIYDELSVGLETVVNETMAGSDKSHASMFTEFTHDIKDRLLHANTFEGINLISSDSREKIVRSNISVFDFFGYIFSRQKTLVLRLANAHGTRKELRDDSTKSAGEDLVLLSEASRRTSNFIHNNARILRQDLLAASQRQQEDDVNVGDLVHTWVYATAQMALDETDAGVLRDINVDEPVVSFMQSTHSAEGRAIFAQRTPSLTARGRPITPDPPNRRVFSVNGSLSGSPSVNSTDRSSRSNTVLPGQTDLAASRVDLLKMQESALRSMAVRRGWMPISPASIFGHNSMQEIDIDEEYDENTPQAHEQSFLATVLEPLLQTEAAFQSAYEKLCHHVIRCCALASHNRSADAVIANLATLKWQQGETGVSAKYFRHILPFYGTGRWTTVEFSILAAYVSCLRKLNLHAEFVQVGLDLIQKTCLDRSHSRIKAGQRADLHDVLPMNGLFLSIIESSRSLPSDYTRELCQFFAGIVLPPKILHRENGIGFLALLRFEYVLPDLTNADEICMSLAPFDETKQEVRFKAVDIPLVPGTIKMELQSSSVTAGAYYVREIDIKIGRLRFVHNVSTKDESLSLFGGEKTLRDVTAISPALSHHTLYLYPTVDTPNIDIGMSRDIHVGKIRRIEITFSNSDQELRSLALRLRSASPGLRLHLADSSCSDFNLIVENNILRLSNQEASPLLAARTAIKVDIPYKLESHRSGQLLIIHLEAECTTIHGTFTVLKSAQIPADLPLDVDVNDVFHVDALISKFTVRTIGSVPLAVLGTELQESRVFNVRSPPPLPVPTVLSQDHPAKLVYKITRKQLQEHAIKEQGALTLTIQYASMDEVMEIILATNFAADLVESGLTILAQLLLPLLSQRFRRIYTSDDMIMAAFAHEVAVKSYDEFAWDDLLQALEEPLRTNVLARLRHWHETHPILPIKQTDLEGVAKRSIVIAVDVPSVDVVHDVTMEPKTRTDDRLVSNGIEVVPIGEPIPARLRIRQSRNWSADSIYGASSTKHEINNRKVRMVYEVRADPNIWLVGGPRRSHFDVSDEDEVLEHDFTLIPLHVGVHGLPVVAISVAPPEDGIATVAPDGGLPASFVHETNLQTAGDLVHVIRDEQQSRVHISESFGNAAAHSHQESK